jgi:signal transduction histidine kinase
MPSTTSDHTARVLTQTVRLLSTAETLDEVTRVVTAAVRAAVGCDGATFVLLEDDLCHYADENAIGPLWKGRRFPKDACISGWALNHRSTVVVPDIYADDRIPHDAYRPTFVTSLVMTPVRRSDPVGAIGAYWAGRHAADDEQVRVLQTIAGSAAVALENLELRGTLDRRDAEREVMAQRTDELESAIQTIAHDLRSPLGAILGYAELLEDVVDDPGTSDKARLFLDTIQAAGRRMADQIDTMLALYRITHRPLAPQVVDLSELGRRVVRDLRSRAGDRDVEVVVEDGLRAVADPVLVQLVLENLLGNAFKFTGREPTAVIALEHVETAPGGAPAPLDLDAFATFVVRDNGDGFPAADAERLFRPMARLHSGEDFPGTGLGLASVARIVELHGGRVCAEGRESAGAAFYFSLPRADRPVQPD